MNEEYVVALTGASGAVYGVELLRALRRLGRPSHLVISDTAAAVLPFETGLSPADLAALATWQHDPGDLFASIASGSYAWRVAGMAIVPCSMKTLAAVAHGYADNLITRAADVMLKERRRLVLVPRETPLSPIHLRNLLALAELGAVVLPPVPAFYSLPRTVEDIVRQTVQRLLFHLGLPVEPRDGWQGLPGESGGE
ncbi:MAG: UbiX family flavin prenyltransferase [Chloroflexi bacterium]|nr:UbiX family flavin prenyltransferase [Chloroflexota bacterium]